MPALGPGYKAFQIEEMIERIILGQQKRPPERPSKTFHVSHTKNKQHHGTRVTIFQNDSDDYAIDEATGRLYKGFVNNESSCENRQPKFCLSSDIPEDHIMAKVYLLKQYHQSRKEADEFYDNGYCTKNKKEQYLKTFTKILMVRFDLKPKNFLDQWDPRSFADLGRAYVDSCVEKEGEIVSSEQEELIKTLVCQQLETVNGDINSMRVSLENTKRVHAEFVAHQKQLNLQVEKAMSELDGRVTGLEDRMDGVNETLEDHGKTLVAHGETLVAHGETLVAHDKKYGEKFKSYDEKLKAIQEQLADLQLANGKLARETKAQILEELRLAQDIQAKEIKAHVEHLFGQHMLAQPPPGSASLVAVVPAAPAVVAIESLQEMLIRLEFEKFCRPEYAGKKVGKLGIPGSTFQKLQPRLWLNDIAIDYFLQLLPTKAVKQCKIFSVYFYSRLTGGVPLSTASFNYDGVKKWTKRGTPLLDKEMALVPLQVFSNHWILAVLSLIDQSILVYDPRGGCFPNVVQNLKKYLIAEYKDKRPAAKPNVQSWERSEKKDPRQPKNNEWDCGVLVCMYAYALAMGRDPSKLNQERILSNGRGIIAASLLQGALVEDPQIFN